MKLKDRFKGAYKILTSQNLSNSLGSIIRNYNKDAPFNPTAQLRGITYKAVDKIGQSLSVYKLKATKANGDVYVNHPISVLQNNPNPRQTGNYFSHLEAMLYTIYGETFWYKVRGENTGKVKEVYLLNPAQIELKVENGELIGYVLHKNDGKQVPFMPDEIHHDKSPNPFNEWRGMSVLERASQYVDIELTTTSFTLNYMRNNASPSGIVSLPNMDRDVFKKFAAQWREGYEGPENAGKTAFIRGGEASFKAVGATLQDVDQEITRKMAKDDVLMMLDMPKGLLGMTGDKGLGRAETEALEYIFAKYKIEPMMSRLDSIWSSIAKENIGRDQPVIITHDSPIPEDKEFIQKQNKELVNVALTVNEVRERMGLEPIPGGDVLNPANTVADTQTKNIKRIKLAKQKTKAEIVKEEADKKESFRKSIVETNDVYAIKVKSEISKFAKKQEASVIGKINASSKAFEEWLFSIKEESIKMSEALLPIMLELVETQAEDVANFITGELITISPQIRKDVEQSILKISGLYNEQTYKALEKTLMEGQANGESLVKLKRRVENTYSEAQGYRAERIARTETLKASNYSAEQVYKESGYTTVEWFVNPGACEFCQSFAGKTKKIGGTYVKVGETITGTNEGTMLIDYSNIDTPPLHPNCSCSLVPGDN